MSLEAMCVAGLAAARDWLGRREPVAMRPGAATDTVLGETGRRSSLVSVDALRGFTILWIVGGDAILGSLGRVAQEQGGLSKVIGDGIATQLAHSHWQGLHFYDLIFPLFLFVTGVSIVLSLGRFLKAGDRVGAWRRIARRTVMLLLLGLIVGGGVAGLWPDVRLMGVLQRIGLCYGAAALIFLHGGRRGVLAATIALLVGYWLVLSFVPVPGLGHGSYAEEANLARWLDERFLPGKQWYGTWDPEGLLGTVPATASCLMGVLAGLVLTDASRTPTERSRILLLAGAACLAAGLLWSLQFPMVKKIWTSSYALAAGGWSFLLLGLFHEVIDVAGRRRWAGPLVWIGANTIMLYLIQNLLGFEALAKRLAGGDIAAFLDRMVSPGAGLLVVRLVAMGLVIALARYFYRRAVFIRV